MKKYINISMIYAIVAMVGGVFYREFSKFNDFEGITMLSKVHTHLFMLGMLVFLIVALFARNNDLNSLKTFRVFMWIYNIGISLTAVMMVVRGIIQVRKCEISSAVNSSISGIAGIGHILTGVGIILLLVSLKRIDKDEVSINE